MRRKAFGSWYFVLIMNGNNAYLNLENKNRFHIRSMDLEIDRIGSFRLMEAEDKMYEWAIANHIA